VSLGFSNYGDEYGMDYCASSDAYYMAVRGVNGIYLARTGTSTAQLYYDTYYGGHFDLVVDNTQNCNLIVYMSSTSWNYGALLLLDKNLNYLRAMQFNEGSVSHNAIVRRMLF
jgi:hypothetical protein